MDERLRALLQHAADIILVVGRDGTVTYASPAVATVLGYDVDAVVGQDAAFFGHPDENPATTAAAASLDPDGTTRMEVRARHADGTWRHLEVVFTDRTGDPFIEGLVVNARDITERVQAESERRNLAEIVQSSPDAIAALSPDGLIEYWSRGACEMFGYTEDEVLGQRPDFLSPRGHMTRSQELLELALEGQATGYESDALHRDGHHIDVSVAMFPRRSPNGTIIGASAIIRDVSDQVRTERELRTRSAQQAAVATLGERALSGTPLPQLFAEAAEHLGTTLGLAVVNIFEIDPDGTHAVLRAAHGGARGEVDVHQVPVEPGSWLGALLDQPLELTSSDLRAEARFELPQLVVDAGLTSGMVVKLEGATQAVGALAVADRRTRQFSDDDRWFLQAVANVLAGAIERNRVSEEMRHRAMHDALTGLPNRALLLDRLHLALQRADRRDEQVGVLFIDIDRFKRINDTLGHHAGDRVLAVVALRLEQQLRPGDTVARLGGDEFIVLCEDLADVDLARELASRGAATVAEPIVVGDHDVVLTVSVGIAMGRPGDEPSALLRDADVAMYRAKQRGRNRIEVFDDAMRAGADERLRTEEALHRALSADQLELAYQPQVDLRTGGIIGVEALLRWQHPEWGVIYPDAFVPVAEDAGLIVDIGAWVIERACADGALLRSEVPGLAISVNLSTLQLTHPRLVPVVQRCLHRYGLPPAALVLEITETALLDERSSAPLVLRRLRDIGVQLSIDDFGTGYSSLSYLTRMPVQEVKIDRAFTTGLDREPGPPAIVAAVVAMAHALGLRTVAEGVERREQARLLCELGCDGGQGWLWSGPRPLDDLLAWLSERRSSTAV